MRQGIIAFAALLTSVNITAAQPWNWALDPKCGDGQGSYAEGIERGMIEALNRADIAVQTINAAQADNNHLAHNLFETIMGKLRGTQEYNEAVDRILVRYTGSSKHSRNPSPHKAMSAGWIGQKTPRDLEFWCSADSDRYEVRAAPNGQPAWWNKNVQTWDNNYLHDEIVALVTSQDSSQAITERHENPVYQNGVLIGLTEYAHTTININPTFMDTWRSLGWPAINQAYIQRLRDPRRRAELERVYRQSTRTPANARIPFIDLVATFDNMIFHEIMHTPSAGFPRAVDEPRGQCYEWDCVVAAKNENNADSLAFLALCLQLLSINYFCEPSGELTPL